MSFKEEKTIDLIKKLAAEFFERESSRVSLMTITDAKVSSDLKNATVFFTVLPESKEAQALDFAKRKRGEFREFFKDHSRIMKIPFFDFEIDLGEKNRQRIDEISNEPQ